MFEIKDVKTIMDSIHGYISIPRCFVENLIDTECFQRLRNIDQTGMRVLYPNAKHDRFSHSLGVFYLGSKAVDALLDNFSDDKFWSISSDSSSIVFWAKNKVLFLIACLLHDIGHAPFSHSLENEIYRNSGDYSIRKKLAHNLNTGECFDEVKPTDISSASHEQLGALLIFDEYRDKIEKIYDALIEMSYPNINTSNILYAEYYNYNPVINKKDFDSDLCFIARMILGLKYQDYVPEKQIRNCFIELLNGSNFDVDKLDYTIRDTKMSGISNISIDVERLLKSISIVTKTIYKNMQFDKDERLSNIPIHSIKNEDDKNMQISINGSFKGTFKFAPSTEVIIEDGSTFVSLTGTSSDANISFLDGKACALFTPESKVIQDSTPIETEENVKPLHPVKNNKNFDCTILSGELLGSNFGFKIGEVSEKSGVELTVNGNCNISIKGEFSAKNSFLFFDNTSISGKPSELVVLQDMLTDSVPTANCYNTFSIGFKKQAINIIANVLEARDYLYLWCYAHHKVTYYANFLIPAVSYFLLHSVESSAFPYWELKYKDLKYLDDAYIWTVFRSCKSRCHYLNNKSVHLQELLNELLNRKYKNSVWKSLSEYEIIFEKFNDNQKKDISNFFSQNINISLPFVENKEGKTAGFICNEFIDLLKEECPELDKLKNIVFVSAGYSMKQTDRFNTFIFINNEVVSMDRIQLLADKVKVSTRSTSHYFYLYFDMSEYIDRKLLLDTILKMLERNVDSIQLEKMIGLNYNS